MEYFKAYSVHLDLESPNNLIFHNLRPEAVAEVASGTAEDIEVEFMVVSMVMDVVANEDVVEGSMFITHMNFQKVRNICVRGPCVTCRPMEAPLLATK